MWSDAGEYDSYLSFGRVSRPALFSEAPAVRTVGCFIHLLHEVLFMRSVLSESMDDELKAKIEQFIRECVSMTSAGVSWSRERCGGSCTFKSFRN